MGDSTISDERAVVLSHKRAIKFDHPCSEISTSEGHHRSLTAWFRIVILSQNIVYRFISGIRNCSSEVLVRNSSTKVGVIHKSTTSPEPDPHMRIFNVIAIALLAGFVCLCKPFVVFIMMSILATTVCHAGRT